MPVFTVPDTPSLVNLTIQEHHYLAVYWKKESDINGPITSYQLFWEFINKKNEYIALNATFPPNTTNYTIENLPAHTLVTMKIVAFSVAGGNISGNSSYITDHRSNYHISYLAKHLAYIECVF